jgi:hypothetical protein
MNRIASTSRGLVGLAGALAVVILAAAPGAAAPPGAATLVGPEGVVTGTTHTFTWQAVAGATFYYLWLNDATTTPRVTLWYPTGQVCAADSATCFVSLSTGLAMGVATWWVHSWNAEGYGPWSEPMYFTVASAPPPWGLKLAAADRFQTVLSGAAVLDRETGLVWDRSPLMSTRTWSQSHSHCVIRERGSRQGWRLPTREELQTLIDPDQPSDPPLPPGHPFTSIGANNYWSASTMVDDSSFAYAVSFFFGGGFVGVLKTTTYRTWCVRGGYGFGRTD